MLLSIDASISLGDDELQDFLFDSAQNTHVFTPPPANGLVNDPADRRSNPDRGPQTLQTVKYLVRELYQVQQRNSLVGVNSAIIVVEQDLRLSIEYWLYLAPGVSVAATSHARDLFNMYDPTKHGSDIQSWVRANLGIDLTVDMFSLETVVRLDKEGQFRVIDTRQLDALFALYQGTNAIYSLIHIADCSLTQWAVAEGVKLIKIGRERVLESHPPKASNVVEIAQPVKADALDTLAAGILDTILNQSVDQGVCGAMQPNKDKVITVNSWPEFKVEWKPVRISIGCSTLTIWYPVVNVRIVNLVLYVYYSIPVKVIQSMTQIARSCAVRAALSAAVLGVVTGNILAAAAAFEGAFKSCVMNEILDCVHPGIILIRETGDWQPI